MASDELVKKMRKALEPFARVAASIPPDLADGLWTECKSYPIPVSDEEVAALKQRGVELTSRESQLLLWVDGITIGMFREAKAALTAANEKLR